MHLIRGIVTTVMLLGLWFPGCLSTSIRVDTDGSFDRNRVNDGRNNGGLFSCPDGKRIAHQKLCDGHFDCPDGSDEICTSEECNGINQCQCAHSKQCVQLNESHYYAVYKYRSFSPSHLYAKPGYPMMLECPMYNAAYIKVVNWYRNNAAIPSKCQITPPTKTAHQIARLFCPNMQFSDEGVYTCEENYSVAYRNTDVVVTVRNESTFNRESCFCFGATSECRNAKVVFGYKRARMFSDSLSFIHVTTKGKAVFSNYTIFKGKTNEAFYALSEKITGKKLELYGGWFTYKIQPLSQKLVETEETAPLAVMRGAGKVLVYKSGKENKNSHWKRLSFSKPNWHLLHGSRVSDEKASEADIMMVLSNLDGIYVRVRSVIDYDRGENMMVDLYTMKFKNEGFASIFGKCSCPPGYVGDYCERCAENYSGNPMNKTSCHRAVYVPSELRREPINRIINDNYRTHIKEPYPNATDYGYWEDDENSTYSGDFTDDKYDDDVEQNLPEND